MKPKQASSLSIKRIGCAIIYSIQGIQHALETQAAFKQITTSFFLAQILNYFTPFTDRSEKYLLFALLFIPLITEICNCAIENLADAISEEYSEKIKNAKDCASAMTFLSITMLVFLYSMMFYNYFWGN